MRQLIFCLNIVVLCIVFNVDAQKLDKKIVCYYNTKSHLRPGQGKFEVSFLDPALQFCTHLVYGYAGINPNTYKLVSLNENYDITQKHFTLVTDLKKRFPGLKVLLSVGGNEDIDAGAEDNPIYRTILEKSENRLTFVESAKQLLKTYGFDGLDLGWEFPPNKPKKIRGKFSNFFHNIKKKIVGDSVIDEKSEEHKEEFTALVRDIKNSFKFEGLLLTLSVLPNVNSTLFYNPRELSPNLDFITLKAFDYYTPQRNPDEADFTSPLYELLDRKVDENIDYQIRYWTQNGAPTNKIVLGVPAFARAWKLNEDSGISGVPPLTVEGPASAGPYSKEAGILSQAEICLKLANPQRLAQSAGTHLKLVNDVTGRHGTYAFRVADSKVPEGIWISYDDYNTIGNKAAYVNARGLGGIAIDDLTLDDFRGLCAGDKYPILRAARYRLTN